MGGSESEGEGHEAKTPEEGSAASREDIFAEGSDFERTFPTSKGPVGILAEVRVEGRTVTLDSVAVYGQTEENLTGLLRDMVQAKDELANLAKQQGFAYIRLRGIRVPGSSSAKPGRVVDLLIDTRTGRLVR